MPLPTAQPWPVGLRRPQVSRRLQALRLGQPGRPKGRAPRDHRHQPRAPRSTASTTSSSRAMRRRASSTLFDTLMTRADDEPDAVYGLVAQHAPRLRPTASRSRSSCGPRPSSPTAPRSPPTTSSSRFDDPEGEGPPAAIACQLRDVAKAEALDAAHRALHLQGRPDARSAPGGRRAADPVEGLLRQRASSSRPRSSRRSARAPTRSAISSPAHSSATSAAPTTGPRTCPSTAAASISTSCATNTIATARPRWRASRPAPTTCARSSPRVDWATGYDMPAVKEGRILLPHPARREPVRRAGLLPQHPAAEARRRARAQGARLRLRLRVDQQEHLLWPLQAHRELLRELRHEGHRASRAPAELALLEPFRDKLPAEVFDEPYTRRSRTARARIANCCARPGGC